MSGSPDVELTLLERELRALAPNPARFDRDAVLFRAGQASAPRGWFWPAATALSTGAACVLGVLLALRPAPPVVERILHVPAAPTPTRDPVAPIVPPAAPSPEEPEPLHPLRDQLLRKGLEGIPETTPSPAGTDPRTAFTALQRALLEELP